MTTTDEMTNQNERKAQNERIEKIRNNPAKSWPVWVSFAVVALIFSILISWGASVAITAIFSLLLISVSISILGLTSIISLITLIYLAGITIYKAWEIVPENHEMLVELNGKYMATWKSGLHFAFPFFGFMKCRALIDMAETSCVLFEDPKEEIDFHDASAPIISSGFFRVVDSFKAVYAIDNYKRSFRGRMEGALRSTCGLYNLDEANMDKSMIDLPAVIIHHEDMNGVKQNVKEKAKEAAKTSEKLDDSGVVERDEIVEQLRTKVLEERETYTERLFYKEILDDWGLEATKLTISDIVIPKEIKEARELKLIASEQLEAAEKQNVITILKAGAEAEATERKFQAEAKGIILKGEAEVDIMFKKVEVEAKGITLKGEALADQIKSLVEKGKLTPAEAKEMIEAIKKWDSLGDKTVVLENSLSDSMSKKFVELGLLGQTGSNITKQ